MSMPNLKLNTKIKLPTLTLKVTERDKKLLAISGVIMLIVISYYFLYQPMKAKTEILKNEQTKIEAQVTAVQSSIKNEVKIIQEYTTVLNKVNERSGPFFPKVYPYKDRYILLLEKIVTASGATAGKISFTDPVVGEVPMPKQSKPFELPGYPLQDLAKKINSANSPLNAPTAEAAKPVTAAKASNPADKAMPADALLRLPSSLEVKGSYAQIRALITNLENLKRAVAIEGVDMVTSEDGTVTANFTLSFYALEKVDNAADLFNSWTVKGSYGKTDLFK